MKRGEPFCCSTDGPHYSRYTQHKVVVSFHAPTPPSPHRRLSSGPRVASKEFRSPPPHRKYPEQHFSLGECTPIPRDNSFDGPLSPTSHSPIEFRELSSNPSLYNNHVSTPRCGSVDNYCISPQSAGSTETAVKHRFEFGEKNCVTNNQKTKRKLSSAISKHSVSVFAAAVFKGRHEWLRTREFTVSCPDLIQDRKSQELPINVNSSVSALDSITKKGTDLFGGSKNNLKVPDIFTTSFTHSNTTDNKPGLQKSFLSLQDYPTISRSVEKNNLQRTLSLTKTDPDDLKIGCLLSPNMYRDDQIAQITEYMFIGSIESAFNDRRLCRLDIESLVDISNLNEMQVPSHKKIACPCLCQIDFKHFRSRLIIAVPDDENEGIDQYFEEVNKFIEGARRCSKKVLIYSYEGKSRAALFAVQYLMSYEGLLLRQAYNMVKKQRPQVSLNPAFQKALEKLEKTLFPDEKHSVNMCNEYLNVADPQAIKCAWIDC